MENRDLILKIIALARQISDWDGNMSMEDYFIHKDEIPRYTPEEIVDMILKESEKS